MISTYKGNGNQPVPEEYSHENRFVGPVRSGVNRLGTARLAPGASRTPVPSVPRHVHTGLVPVLEGSVTPVADVSRTDPIECRRRVGTSHLSPSSAVVVLGAVLDELDDIFVIVHACAGEVLWLVAVGGIIGMVLPTGDLPEVDEHALLTRECLAATGAQAGFLFGVALGRILYLDGLATRGRQVVQRHVVWEHALRAVTVALRV